MRNPTPVTTSVSAPESRSNENAMSTCSEPAENQLNQSSWKRGACSPRPMNARSPMRNESRTDASATAYTQPLGSHFPTSPQTAAPIRGSRGTRCSQVTSTLRLLQLQRVELVDIDRGAAAEDGDDDGEADRGLRGGSGDDEEHRRMAGEEAPHRRVGHQREAGERQEGEIHGVEHQLDAHEDDDRVAPQHDAGGAEREEHRRKHEIMLRLVGVKEVHQILPFATTTAATTATSRRSEVTSNGRIEARYKMRPTVLTPPNPATSKALSTRRSPCISAPWGNAGPSALQAITPKEATTAASPMPFQAVIRCSPNSSSLRFRSMITNTNSTITAPAYTMICRIAIRCAASRT